MAGICVVVDDFGMYDGICEAALHLAAMDRVHAIGCLVGGKAWPAWHPLLARLDAAAIDVGLHLDLTERPLTMAAVAIKRLIAGSQLRLIDRRAIRIEVGAQLDGFESAIGRAPAFIDGHQHVHQFPGVRDILIDLLSQRYAGRLPWVRATHTGFSQGGRRPRSAADSIKPWIIHSLGADALAVLSRRAGIQQNWRLWGVYDFAGNDADYLERLDEWLGACRDGDLLMCHPSLSTDPGDPLAAARIKEFEVLSGIGFGKLLQRQTLGLEPMSHILARHAQVPIN